RQVFGNDVQQGDRLVDDQRERLRQLAQERRERHAFGLDVHRARLELGEVEEFLDQVEEVGGVGEHLFEHGPRVGGAGAERPLAQQIDVADDDVERRAKLVRDVGEELRLQPLRDVQLGQLIVGLERDVDPEEQAV